MQLAIPDVLLLQSKRYADSRGWFTESWSRKALDVPFCQDNQSLSLEAGTIRGLHFQKPPHAQSKLVSVLSGRVLDIAVDIRKSSPTFGQHVAVELSAQIGEQLFVPKGFAHGFCTLEPATIVMYKVDAFYAPESDAGILWNDADLKISWPIPESRAILSTKDAALPRLSQFVSPF